jgi:uncharacterized membrane protein
MRLPRTLPRIDLRTLAAALVAVAILHILATLAAPHLASAPAVHHVMRDLPLNAMKLLPPLTRAAQPLPFLAPDARYAMCRFDTAKGAVLLNAVLPEAGWTLAIYTPAGDNIYVASGQSGQVTTATIRLVPSGDIFTGLTPESRGLAPAAQQPLSFAVRRGVAVVRAPERGEAYRRATDTTLAKASCVQTER